MSRSEASLTLPGPAPVFAALGDPTRLGLLARLSDGEPRSISELSTDSILTRQAVTKHLRVLEQAGLVRGRRVGRESRFEYLPERVVEAKAYLEGVSSQWDETLGRLRAFVEE
ncbi:MAG: ArsR/SmtB family transcription factor [Thermoanaerobaculia bacterium]